jgi:hypothetical protein
MRINVKSLMIIILCLGFSHLSAAETDENWKKAALKAHLFNEPDSKAYHVFVDSQYCSKIAKGVKCELMYTDTSSNKVCGGYTFYSTAFSLSRIQSKLPKAKGLTLKIQPFTSFGGYEYLCKLKLTGLGLTPTK